MDSPKNYKEGLNRSFGSDEDQDQVETLPKEDVNFSSLLS